MIPLQKQQMFTERLTEAVILFFHTLHPGQQRPQILMISAEPTDSNLKINHNPFFKQFLSYYCDLHSPTPSFFANGIGLRTKAPVGLQCIPLVLKVINTLLLLRARCLRLHQIEP